VKNPNMLLGTVFSRVSRLGSKNQGSIQEISREERKKEASKPLYLVRYE
jgi:hypothetical protein